MKKALILHGTDASPEANWFRWLEKVLISSGYEVWLPQLPDSAKPNTKTYNDFLFSNANFEFNSETTIIGHSSGAVEILSLLQHLPDDVTVGDVYLVSAFRDSLGWDALDGLFMEPYEYSAIKERARSITLIHSDNDPYVPQQHPRYLAEQLSARLLIIGGQGHFNLEQSDDYRSFPLLAQIIETTHVLTTPEKLVSFRGEPVVFIETQQVTDGVACDVYAFTADSTKDLGIIHIEAGASTPKRLILKGDKTVEGFLAGEADFAFSKATEGDSLFGYTDDSYGNDTTLGVGDTMQWSAIQDSVCYEICYPSYEDRRFEQVS